MTVVAPFVAKGDTNAQVKAVVLAKVEDPDKVVVIVRKLGELPTKKEAREDE